MHKLNKIEYDNKRIEGDYLMSLDSIGAKEVINYIGKNNIIIIDLRSHISYQRGHIPTAINIPYNQVEYKLDTIPSCKELILYCERGNLSLLLGRELSQLGYQVKSIYGGINAYMGRLEK